MASGSRVIRAAVYCRISDDRSGAGLGVERQRKECCQLAKSVGWTVVETYIDNDISAFTGKRRPAYERLVTDIAAGSVDAVVTWHPDRLNRSPRELERLIDLLERNAVQLQSVTAGVFDLSTPSGRAVARTLGAWARYESEHKSERIRSKLRELALAGHPGQGQYRPFGYAADKVTPIEAEALIIRSLMRRLLSGSSTRELASSLNDAGITTPEGNRWVGYAVARVLVSARIAGWRAEPISHASMRILEPAFLAPAQWPAIVSRRQVMKARLLLADETLREDSTNRWLLSSIIRCGHCGAPMSSTHADNPGRRYICMRGRAAVQQCGRSIASRIEPFVVARIMDAVRQGLMARVAAAGPSLFQSLYDEVKVYDSNLRAAERQRRDGAITARQLGAIKNSDARRTASTRRGASDVAEFDLSLVPHTTPAFEVFWEQSTIRQRRTMLRIFVSSLVALPYDSAHPARVTDRIAIEWRS